MLRGRESSSKKASGFAGRFLGYRDWVYLFGLLVPFVVYNLALKASEISSRSDDYGLALSLDLMRSDIFFNLGYALFWIGLFAAVRREPARWVMVLLFHATTIVVVFITTCAYQYFLNTGTTLDYAVIAEWAPKVEEIKPILTHDISYSAWILLLAALSYVTLGPWFIARVVGRWRGWPVRPASGMSVTSFLCSVGLWLLAAGLVSLSLLIGPGAASVGKAFARDPFVNVVLTGVQKATAEENGSAVEHSAANASLVPTPWTEKRNVVLIHLESTRAQAVTPYNKDLETTPFLDELADSSLLVEQARATLPRSSKSSVSVNCGIDPPLYPGPEFEPDGIPVPCLAGLLRDQDYQTVFFASTANNMDNFGDVVQGFGYEEFYPLESMNAEGFQQTNTFGVEDDVMLEPSKEWLEERGDEPFMAEYFTGTGHYGYECSSLPTGFRDYTEDEELNRYLNCVHYLDSFVEKLMDQYKEMGLYEDTIFVIFGDHGEGFGEHERYMHGDTIYEEGLHVPLLIHAPGLIEGGERIEGIANHADIMPTVLELLGYKVKDGEYPGYSLLHEPPEDRTLMFSCITDRKCMASIKGNEKYIYHYDNQPAEVFDLSEDPLEKNNLAGEYSQEELDRRREELLQWASDVNAAYRK